MTNHYRVLGVSESVEPEVIEAAWKTLLKKYHPDNSRTGDAKRAKQINLAHDILSDPAKRKAHDLEIAARRNGNGHGESHDAGGARHPFEGFNPFAYPPAYDAAATSDVNVIMNRIGQHITADVLGYVFSNAPAPLRDAIRRAMDAQKAAQK